MKHLRQIILDTETTGLYPNAAENPDRLIEFAGLEMRNRSFTDEKLHLYVHPQRDIPAEAAAPASAGQNKANPTAAILAGAMLLRHLGYESTAVRIEDAVEADMRANGARTRGTDEVGNDILGFLS